MSDGSYKLTHGRTDTALYIQQPLRSDVMRIYEFPNPHGQRDSFNHRSWLRTMIRTDTRSFSKDITPRLENSTYLPTMRSVRVSSGTRSPCSGQCVTDVDAKSSYDCVRARACYFTPSVRRPKTCVTERGATPGSDILFGTATRNESGIGKSYGTAVVVSEVSFEVTEDEIFGLIGPNGAGKTTTMECAEGPDRGTLGQEFLVTRQSAHLGR